MNTKNKNIILSIIVIFVGLLVAGGTYAFLTFSLNVTNGEYATGTECFNIEYNVNNGDGTQDITGTLFPSASPSGGLSGRVGIKVNSSCSNNGLGTLKLHINNTTSLALTTPATSYCEDRSTLEPIDGITTEADCKDEEVNGRWRGYGDSYCESNTTLERLDYKESECASNGGTWKSGGSPLKYAVYNNPNAIGTPLSKGYITTANIGNDITIYDNFMINLEQQYYYIYIWLDGYLTDSTYTELPFSGYINASATQTATKTIYRYSTESIVIGDSISPTVVNKWCDVENSSGTVYDCFDTENECTQFLQNIGDTETHTCTYGVTKPGLTSYETNPTNLNKTLYLKHTIDDNVVTESYVGFIVTPEMASANEGMTAGTYYLKGGDGGTAYEQNKTTLLSAIGSTHCTDTTWYFRCRVSGLNAYVNSYGIVNATGGASARCDVNGDSYCE